MCRLPVSGRRSEATVDGRKGASVGAEMECVMIDFDEEIKKCHPSLEVEEAEDAIYNNDLTDAVDLMLEMMKEKQQ